MKQRAGSNSVGNLMSTWGPPLVTIGITVLIVVFGGEKEDAEQAGKKAAKIEAMEAAIAEAKADRQQLENRLRDLETKRAGDVARMSGLSEKIRETLDRIGYVPGPGARQPR